MSVYSNTVILPKPSAISQSSINTKRQFTTNNGQTKLYNGMPAKDGPANNSSSFGVARQFYFGYKVPDSLQTLKQLYKDQNLGNQTSNTIVKTSQKEAGKPITQNSSDLYIQRRRLATIGQGSTKPQNMPNEIIQLKGGEDKNYTNRRLNYCKAGGCIAQKKKI